MADTAEPTAHVLGVGDRTLCCRKREADLPRTEPILLIDLGGRVTCKGAPEWSEQDARDVSAWLIREADQRVKFFPQRRDGVDALMRHLASELVSSPESTAH